MFIAHKQTFSCCAVISGVSSYPPNVFGRPEKEKNNSQITLLKKQMSRPVWKNNSQGLLWSYCGQRLERRLNIFSPEFSSCHKQLTSIWITDDIGCGVETDGFNEGSHFRGSQGTVQAKAETVVKVASVLHLYILN